MSTFLSYHRRIYGQEKFYSIHLSLLTSTHIFEAVNTHKALKKVLSSSLA